MTASVVVHKEVQNNNACSNAQNISNFTNKTKSDSNYYLF